MRRMRNVQIDVPEFGVGLVDHHNFVRSLNKMGLRGIEWVFWGSEY
jgi:hypothetical protein